MSKTEKLNSYYQEQQLNRKVTVETEVKKEKTKISFGFGSTALSVLSALSRFSTKSIASAKTASANNKRALVLTFSTVTFSITNVLLAVFITSNKGMPLWLALGLNLILSGLTTYLFTKFVFYFVNLSKPKQAPKPKQPSPQEQMQNQLMLMQMMKG